MVVHPTPAPALAPEPSAASLAAASVRRARPDLDSSHALFRAAVLMLCAPAARFNIDRLTRESGFARPFVAACARRLYDNGVWRDGAAVYAAPSPGAPAFWNDAAVAVGGLCRRIGEAGPEWAPPGTWSKPYEYVGAARGPGLAIAYRDALASEDGAISAGWEDHAEPDAGTCPDAHSPGAHSPGAETAGANDAAGEPPAPWLRGHEAVLRGDAGVKPADRHASVPGAALPAVLWLGPAPRVVGLREASREMFPDAVWLG